VEGEAKACKKCGAVKFLTEFAKNSFTKDGRLNCCKACANERAKTYRAENIEKLRENRGARHIKYKLAHPDKIRAEKKKFYWENRDKCILKMKVRSKRLVEEGSAGYIASLLGSPIAFLNPLLIEAKREHLRLVRLIKEQSK
jgi:hypothetical protein